MWWWPWQSGRTRDRDQKAESLKRATESATRLLDAASEDNRKASVEVKATIALRRERAAPLRPLLKQLISRLTVD